jgi:hypothetical protein
LTRQRPPRSPASAAGTPRAGLLVVAGRVATGASCWQEMEIADLLDAGADIVMVEMSTRELAARRKAPARRRLAAVPPGQAP